MKAMLVILIPVLVSCAGPSIQPLMPVRSTGNMDPTFRASEARVVEVPWHYDLPQGTFPSNFWWNLEHSLDLRNWSVIASNVTGIPTVEATNKQGFFRLEGRL